MPELGYEVRLRETRALLPDRLGAVDVSWVRASV